MSTTDAAVRPTGGEVGSDARIRSTDGARPRSRAAPRSAHPCGRRLSVGDGHARTVVDAHPVRAERELDVPVARRPTALGLRVVLTELAQLADGRDARLGLAATG